MVTWTTHRGPLSPTAICGGSSTNSFGCDRASHTSSSGVPHESSSSWWPGGAVDVSPTSARMQRGVTPGVAAERLERSGAGRPLRCAGYLALEVWPKPAAWPRKGLHLSCRPAAARHTAGRGASLLGKELRWGEWSRGPLNGEPPPCIEGCW